MIFLAVFPIYFFILLRLYYTTARPLSPIFADNNIKKISGAKNFRKIAAVECEDSIHHSATLVPTLDLNWTTTTSPIFTTPLLMCGIAEGIMFGQCKKTQAEFRVIFMDMSNGKQFQLTNTIYSFPAQVCIELSSCNIWNLMNQSGFTSSPHSIQIAMGLTVTGMASPRQLYVINIEGSSVIDLRIPLPPGELLAPYQAERSGYVLYAIPWRSCSYKKADQQCSPVLDLFPGYRSLHRRFVFMTSTDTPYPVCIGSPKEDANIIDIGSTYNAIELSVHDLQEAVYGFYDLVARWSYIG